MANRGRKATRRLRDALGGQLDTGTFTLFCVRAGQPDRADAWINAVAADEEYWLFHPDYTPPSSTATLTRWKVVYEDTAQAAGCGALRDWVCAHYAARVSGVTLSGESFAITDEGDFTCS